MTILEASKKLGIRHDTLYRRVKQNPSKYGARKLSGSGRGMWVLDGRKVK